MKDLESSVGSFLKKFFAGLLTDDLEIRAKRMMWEEECTLWHEVLEKLRGNWFYSSG